LRNVLRNPEDLALVLAYQSVVGRDVACAYLFNQGNVRVLFDLAFNRLDGRHLSWLRKILRRGSMDGNKQRRSSLPDAGGRGQL
jgi:hypothetical protein